MYLRDTIAAVGTPPGNGGIGIVRVSGDKAVAIGNAVFKPIHDGGLRSHRFYFGLICNPENDETLDEAMAVMMHAPRSYTREDVLELHCHGGWLIVEKVLSVVLCCGARLAEPGEFTRRAFLNGRIDLVQAEAVMDIICSKTDAALRFAQKQREGLLSRQIEVVRGRVLRTLALVEAYIDFPEDGLGETDLGTIHHSAGLAFEEIGDLLRNYDEGRILREGISVLIIGKPNVGKSSLLNRLLNENRAIVTHIPGTTRDIIEETVNFDGLAVRLLDTAGIRHTKDLIEQEGINRALEKIPLADLVLLVFDVSRAFNHEDQLILDALSDCKFVTVLNKSDLPCQLVLPEDSRFDTKVNIAAHSGFGIDDLKRSVRGYFSQGKDIDCREFISISRTRHRDALLSAERALRRFIASLDKCNLELLAIDLRDALDAIGSVTGQTVTEDVLDVIFSSFCIGK
ncbi:MAG: tRNA uridine-5-carboxymethylaminomethyl(34) synthesis GTPase MnmE [Desulfuromonadales bacterium]